MTISYFPFDSGQGANTTEAQWGQMAQLWLNTGVIKGKLNELSVYADSTGMQAKVKSGQAWIQGYFFQTDAEIVMPISAADASNPRIDRVVVRVDWTANTIALAVLQGTPAASPSAPAVTQNTDLWEISLAQVRVNAAVSTIAAGNITDERIFVGFAAQTPFFYSKVGLWGGIGTANTINQLPIALSQTPLTFGFTISGYDLICNIPGTYKLEFTSVINTLGAGQTFDTLIRVISGGVNHDDDCMIITPSALTGTNNPQGLVCFNSITYQLQAGDKIQFYVRSSDAPHNLNESWINGYKISN